MWNDKPDGYPIPARNLTGTGMNFYPWVWVRVRISTRSLFAGGWVIALPDQTRPVAIPAHLSQEMEKLVASRGVLVQFKLSLSSGQASLRSSLGPATSHPWH
jgi:hypothetical protein